MDDGTGDSPTLASTLTDAGGALAGRYRVRARLGRGASKEVYLAYDERLDRDVALAIVVGAASSDGARARVAREAQVTGRLGDHPNIVTVYDVGELDGVAYLVLRAMAGGSLAAALRRERPSLADVLRIGREIALALGHAHAHGVVHRDVKPDNIWLAADGSAALGDFGIAHREGAERLTAEGVVVGTVRYLAPEQIRGDEVGPASDLYALGVTLYELVTGRPPFTAEDPAHVLTQHLTAAPLAPSQLEPSVPAALDSLILQLLAKAPERRPASATAVGEALAALAASPAAARSAPTPSVATPPSADGAARRVVTVLAARVEGSDPEALHGVFERCSSVIERHGGTVERYLGDALVCFFGLDASHDDDALRATRAAVELRAQTAELRLGIETGEVFLAAGPRGATITGAAITNAERLAERATVGEILLGDDVRHVVGAEASIEPASGRLLELAREQPALLRAPATPFVGRGPELELLREAFARVRSERACRLVTVAGPPGIGKSRLAGEFIAAIGDDATVLAGRCLAYGEGTTYRALAEIVGGLGDDPRGRVEQLLADDEQAVRCVLGAAGLSPEPAQADETAWALRRLLERIAPERPLVVAVEDVHWADEVMLDLLDHLVALSSGAAILLVCLTRPELLESRPAWAAPQPNRSLLVLDPLAGEQARELAERLGAGQLAPRIARRAEGNPLFVEQLVAVDRGQDTGELPASIQAVLGARIDALEDGERSVLQRAAVEGRTFHRGALAELVPDEERRTIATRLVALTRTGLIGPDRPVHAGEDAFRFTHDLIREAAYAGVPKQRRAELHMRVADWLEAQPAAADEIVGFHLEQSCQLTAELGATGQPQRRLAARAAARLEAASRAALGRGDPSGASGLLERALALVQSDDVARGALLPRLGAALYEAGRMTEATRVLDEAIARAPEARLRAHAQIERELVRLETETSAGTTTGRRVGDRVLPVLERSGDDRGQSRVWSLRARIAFIAGRMAEADAAWCRAADCARRAGDERDLLEVVVWRATTALYGPTPVAEAIERCEAFRSVVAASPIALAQTLKPLAVLRAMNGQPERARQQLSEANAIFAELGGLTAHVPHFEALISQLEGRPDLAEAALRADLGPLESMQGEGTLVTTTAMLAQAIYAQGRSAEAGKLCAATARATADDDVFTQVIWRAIQAKVLARRRRCADAEALARSAIERAAATDLLWLHGDGMLDLAEVLAMCSQPDASGEALRAGLALYESKGNIVAAARARALLREHEQET